ncbi:unnamed protein product [Moneuplotes crassus]|uniref:Uncharacterized protein n=1 Tax=Euplotes crassus TaxID=5936 RepID=A0AAD1U8T0_EUPCR|nr:unnamed protein product [Moneuplotes crassus]
MMNSSEIKDISITNSSVSLFKINTFINTTDEPKLLTIKSIKFLASTIHTKRVLISTKGVLMNTNLSINMSELTFENIEFTSSGTLIEIMHQLPTNVTLSDSTFNNITSGLISIEGSKQTEALSTLFSMNNCSFTNIRSSVNAFIAVQQKAEVVITKSLFTNLTLTTFISGIMNIQDKARIKVLNSSFTRNSAATATIFKVISEAVATLDGCHIFENFAITNGVFEAASFGVFNIKNSKIFRNYAIQNLVGSVFMSVEPSNILNTEIYENKLINRSNIPTEISDSCSDLCFLDQEMKEYLATKDLSATSEQKYLFKVLQGNLNILNSTHIHDEDLILKSFLSTVRVERSRITNMQYSISPFNILDSTFTIEDTEINGAHTNSAQEGFIVTNSATIIMKNISFTDSNSQMMISLSSHLEMEKVKFQNITQFPNLVSAKLCNWFHLSEITIVDSYSTKNEIMNVQDSYNVTLNDIKLERINSTFCYFKDSEILAITNITISNLSQGFIFVNSQVIKLANAEFSENYSNSSGGVISMTNSKLKIENTTFAHNSATEGGAIMFECTHINSCQLEVSKSRFENNSATVQGGAISYNYNPPEIKDTQFLGNSAPYGDNYASYPVRIGYVNSRIDDEILQHNIGPGIRSSQNLELALIDLDDQVMILDDENQILILPLDSSKSSVSGTNTVQVKQGVAVFDNLLLKINQEERISNFKIISKSIDLNKVKQVLGNSFRQKDLIVNFRDCEPGERILGDKCEVCAAGTYSLSYNSTECQKCNLDAECRGGSEIYLKPGHWRRFHNSTKIVECITKEACEGKYQSDSISPSVCSEGYTGNLCAQCLVNKDVKYERVNDYECRKCPNVILNSFQVLGMILLVICFYIFMMIINVRKTSESELSVLLRILANYLQLISVSTGMSSNYPSIMVAISIPVKWLGGSSDAFLSFDCFIKDTEMNFLFDSTAIFKLFLLMFLPLILFILLGAIWVILYYAKRQWVKHLTRNIVITFITIVFLLHPKLTERSISMFRCIEIDEGYSVAEIDTNLECFGPKHMKWSLLVALPILIIWVISCPIISIVFLYLSHAKTGHEKIKSYFLILYQGLKPEAFYWELVNTLRKIAILLTLLFQKTVSINLSLMILIVTARVQVYLKPYKNHEHSKIEFLAIMAGVCTITAALVYSQDKQNEVLNVFVLLSVISFNLKFIIEWLFLLLLTYRDKHNSLKSLTTFFGKILCKHKSFESQTNQGISKEKLKAVTTQRALNKSIISIPDSPRNSPKGIIKKKKKLRRRKIKRRVKRKAKRKAKREESPESDSSPIQHENNEAEEILRMRNYYPRTSNRPIISEKQAPNSPIRSNSPLKTPIYQGPKVLAQSHDLSSNSYAPSPEAYSTYAIAKRPSSKPLTKQKNRRNRTKRE